MSPETIRTAMRLGGVAACALALFAGREYYVQSIAPLRLREAATMREAAALSERIENARKTIAGIQAQEKDADRAQSELDRLCGELPAGAARVALPTLASEHFARHGIAVPVVRLNTNTNPHR